MGKSIRKRASTAKKPLVQSVERALDILDRLAFEGRPMRSSEIAAALKLNPNTTHNLVRTLYRRGYLIQHGDARYFLGPQCYHIGTLSDMWESLRVIAMPKMEQLAEETGDGVFLGINAGNDLICVARVQGTGAVIVVEKQEWLQQFHATAAGKVLLAYRPPSLRTRLKSMGELMRITPNTITRWDELEEELARTKKQGYGLCRDEGGVGVGAIGVPLLDGRGYILAALAQSFPSYYFEAEKLNVAERVETLNRFAGEIAHAYDNRSSQGEM